MSETDIVRFLAACAGDRTLDQELAAAERTPDAWVTVGRKAGFAFTAEELHSLAEHRSGHALRREDVVPSLLAPSAPLTDGELEGVAGGSGSDLGSWSKAEGLDVSWSSAAGNNGLFRQRPGGS